MIYEIFFIIILQELVLDISIEVHRKSHGGFYKKKLAQWNIAQYHEIYRNIINQDNEDLYLRINRNEKIIFRKKY